ncbi:hypothetical protein ATO13_22631 [Stappia sp. 22II-S9-Z10]|nr:hypothetical protein ATO13_22631 [Stappia sp. 22II-S9-Z10]
MESKVLFRHLQVVEAEDLNNVQGYTQGAMDRLVAEAVTSGRKFAGFEITAPSTTSVTISVGTYYDAGARYRMAVEQTTSLLAYVPNLSQRYLTFYLGSSVGETGVDERAYLLNPNAATKEYEPRSVAMREDRTAVIYLVAGTESANPSYPSLPEGAIAIGHVLLNTSGVVSIEVAEQNALASTDALDQRTAELEGFRSSVGEKVDTLRTDLSSLSGQVGNRASRTVVESLARNIAAIRLALDIGTSYGGYGEINFVDDSFVNAAAPGYNCVTQDGLRFPFAATATSALALENPSNPDVFVHSDGMMFPDYERVDRIDVLSPVDGDLALSGLEYATRSWRLHDRRSVRWRTGPMRYASVASNFWNTVTNYDYATGTFERAGRTYQVAPSDQVDLLNLTEAADGDAVVSDQVIRFNQVWVDTEPKQYSPNVFTTDVVAGYLVGQSFLNAQWGWLSQIRLKFTELAATGDVQVMIAQTKDGKPGLDIIGRATISHENLKIYKANDPYSYSVVQFIPVLLEPGVRYAIIVQTPAAHRIATNEGANFPDGSMWTLTSGVWSPDKTRNIAFSIRCAKFDNTTLYVPLTDLSLAGGIHDIDVTTDMQSISDGGVTLEARRQGTSEWRPFGDPAIFSGTAPSTIALRAGFIGTEHFMPALKLTNSVVKASRVGTSISCTTQDFVTPSTQDVKVYLYLDNFRQDADHTVTVELIDRDNGDAVIAAGSTLDQVTKVTDADHVRVKRAFFFTDSELTSATTEFAIRVTGTVADPTDSWVGESIVFVTDY